MELYIEDGFSAPTKIYVLSIEKDVLICIHGIHDNFLIFENSRLRNNLSRVKARSVFVGLSRFLPMNCQNIFRNVYHDLQLFTNLPTEAVSVVSFMVMIMVQKMSFSDYIPVYSDKFRFRLLQKTLTVTNKHNSMCVDLDTNPILTNLKPTDWKVINIW